MQKCWKCVETHKFIYFPKRHFTFLAREYKDKDMYISSPHAKQVTFKSWLSKCLKRRRLMKISCNCVHADGILLKKEGPSLQGAGSCNATCSIIQHVVFPCGILQVCARNGKSFCFIFITAFAKMRSKCDRECYLDAGNTKKLRIY